MNRNEKSELAVSLKDKFTRAQVAVFADYKGLSANQANDLRRQLRTVGTEVKVLKNNVARMITNEGGLSADAKAVMDKLVGPTMVAFSYGDPAATAKIISKFAKENEALKIKDSLLGSRRVDVAGVDELASLPSKEILVAKFLGTLNAPITNFVGVLAAVPRGMVTVLSAIEKKKAESST